MPSGAGSPDQDPAALDEALVRLQHLTMTLADTVGRLSHELNPNRIEYVGLLIALNLHCEEFQHQSGVEVTFNATEDLTPIPSDVALCMFRAAEEALRNVAAHAGARRAHVVLSQDSGQRTLTITDDGKGFDTARVLRSGHGLGLIMVEQRARLLNGLLKIESGAGRGTTVRVSIPTAAR